MNCLVGFSFGSDLAFVLVSAMQCDMALLCLLLSMQCPRLPLLDITRLHRFSLLHHTARRCAFLVLWLCGDDEDDIIPDFSCHVLFVLFDSSSIIPRE